MRRPDISKLLIQEPPLQVLPTLAKIIGLNEALVIQQVYYLLTNPKNGKTLDGKQWVFNTYEQWQAGYFPFWSVRTVKAVFLKLQRRGLLVSCQPEGRMSRRKYYSVNTDRLLKLTAKSAKSAPSRKGKELPDGKGHNLPVPITETSSKTSSKEGEGVLRSTPHTFGNALAMPRHEIKTAPFFPRFRYPDSESEMADMLEANGVDYIPDYDGNFFTQMDNTGWVINGEPVWDWIAAYQGRLALSGN